MSPYVKNIDFRGTRHLNDVLLILNFKQPNMGLLNFLFGSKRKKIQELLSQGAIILDVRSKGEYQSGSIPGSKNIPLQTIAGQIKTIQKWDKPVITCCASGMRSSSAAAILKSNGIQAINGGAWSSLTQYIRP